MQPILVVDDDAPVRILMERMLTKAGHAVVVASDPEEAWRHFQAQPFAVVVTDWKMPKGGGEKLIDLIAATSPSVPIVVISSEPGLVTLKSHWDHWPIHVLAKPFDLRELNQLNVLPPPKLQPSGDAPPRDDLDNYRNG